MQYFIPIQRIIKSQNWAIILSAVDFLYVFKTEVNLPCVKYSSNGIFSGVERKITTIFSKNLIRFTLFVKNL